jgi:sphingomyelin phosphodiesterase acid-like 3
MIRSAVLALALLAPAVASPAAAEPGTFLHVSDIHFNPFDPSIGAMALATSDTEDWAAHFAADSDQTFSKYGEDTNHALYRSALTAIGKDGAGADFALLTGDLLVHRFQDNAESVLGFAQGSAANDAFAVRTTLFVLEQLRDALPGKPIFVSLGNNDSSCGDYMIDPGGSYLAATREMVRALAGPELVADDFDQSYLAGGYFAAQHPTHPGTTILVLDDVMWSQRYENACGTGGLDAANAMIAWLEEKLAAAQEAGRKVWLMHHIPVGADAYATAHSKETTCISKVVPMLHEPFASTYTRLLAEYGDTVTASFTGHTHFDEYRLLRDAAGNVNGTEKIAPAISPIFGQNPGYLVYDYDRANGTLSDFRAMYLTNLEAAADPAAGEWQSEYLFSEAYGQDSFSPAGVEAVWKQLLAEGAADDTFRKLYNVSHGELTATDLKAWTCTMGYADTAGFAKCYCGE